MSHFDFKSSHSYDMGRLDQYKNVAFKNIVAYFAVIKTHLYMRLQHIKASFTTILLTVIFQAHAEDGHMFGLERLTSSLITCIEQDETGYIWIGTEYGLNRFDGLTFTYYYNDEIDPDALMSNCVRTMFCDRDGHLWIGLLTGMQMYDSTTDSFRKVDFPNISYTPNISHIIQLASGKIWMIASRLGIFELDTNKMTAHRVNDITNLCGTDHINHFLEDAHGRLWLASEDEGIFCIDKDHKTAKNFTPSGTDDKSASRLAINKNGIITAACGGRLWMFDEVRQSFIPIETSGADVDVRDMILMKNGDFLIATYNNGVLKTDEENSIILPYTTLSNPVCLMEDNEGNLWSGHYHKGAYMIPPPSDRSGL